MLKKIIWLFYLAITISFHASGYFDKKFSHLTIDNGLAHTDAICFAQDSIGFIWIGTNGGLQKYDGQSLKTYLIPESIKGRLISNRITALRNIGQYLWIGTESGIQCLDLKTEKYIDLNAIGDESKIITGSFIADMHINEMGIWIISNNKLYNANFTARKNELIVSDINKLFPELNEKKLNGLTGNSKGTLWIKTHHGINELFYADNGNLILNHLPEELGKGVNIISSYISDIVYNNDMVWVSNGSWVKAMSVSDKQVLKSNLKTIPVLSMWKNNNGEEFKSTIKKIWIDSSNNLWCTTDEGIIFIEEPLAESISPVLYKHSFFDPNTITSNNVSVIYEDKSGCLWFGTWGGGVNILDLRQKKFGTLSKNLWPEKSLNDEYVRTVEEDAANKIWIGTHRGGLNTFDPKTNRIESFNLAENNELEIRKIKSFKDMIYVATITDLFYIIDPASGSVKQHNLNIRNIYDMEMDQAGNIWTAGKFGIHKIEFGENREPKITAYNIDRNNKSGISSFQCNNIVFSEQTNELFISTNAGLYIVQLDSKGDIVLNDKDIETHFRILLRNKYVWPVTFQNDSTIWAGTIGNGLYKIKILNRAANNRHYEIINYSTQDGLPGNDAESLEFDELGNLWIGGKGLSRFDTKTEQFQNFDVNDGLQGNGFKIGSSCCASDGTLYFGGTKGLNYFKPEEITLNDFMPNVVLTSLSVNGQEIIAGQTNNNKKPIIDKTISISKKIELFHYQNNISPSFTSLHYSNPRKCRYRYRLIPYQKNWTYITHQAPFTSYNKLPSGNYTFEAEGTNVDGLWSPYSVQLSIKIRKPWWKSTLALMVYFLLTGSLMFSLYYYISKWIRMRQNMKYLESEKKKKEELHQHKLQFFTNITHEIKTPLTLISTPLEKLYDEEKPTGERKKMYQLAFTNTQRLLKLINELIEFRKADIGKSYLKAQKIHLSGVVSLILDQFKDFAKKKGINLVFNIDEEERIWLDKDKASKIIYNVILNAIKYNNKEGDVLVNVYKGELAKIPQKFHIKFSECADVNIHSFVFLCITDSGIGISENSLPKIFDRFYHINHDPENHLGSGIGLALVKSLTFLHKGCIYVSSERHKGTQVVVGFPTGNDHIKPEEKLITGDDDIIPLTGKIEKETVLAEENPGNENITEKKPTLLLVEDNKELREMLHVHFHDRYHIELADNGKAGFDLALQIVPDLIISDVMMPEMNGFELCQYLREDINTSHIPIILLTAMSSIENQIKGAEYGADIYVTKPFNLKLLDVNIGRMLENNEKLKKRYSADIYATTREIAKNNKDSEFMEKIITLVEENMIEEDFSIEDLCITFGMGRTSLYKKLKSITGQSPVEFVRSLRLKKAAKILVTEDVSISEAMFRVGIQSNSYFTKAFKAQFNVTPTEFIQQHSIASN